MVKTISILSNVANSILLASDSNSLKGLLDHINIAKICKNKITLLSYISAEFETMRKNSLRIIVNTDLVALFGSKPGSVAKVKLKKFSISFLIWG